MTPHDAARPPDGPGGEDVDGTEPRPADAPEPDEPDPRAPSPSRLTAPRRRGPSRAVALLSLLCLVLAATAVGLGLALREQREEQRARAAALAAARQEAVNLTSIDHRQLDRDLQRVLDGATGAFKEDFAARSDDLRQLLTENQVVSEGSVLEAGLVRASGRRATALVVVDSTVRNTAETEGSTRNYRVQVDLVRNGSRWLVSSLQFVG